MPKLNPEVTKYIAALHSPQKEICEALRKWVLGVSSDLEEEYKWRYPIYYYKKKRICLFGGHKAHTTLELFYGSRLEDKKGLIEGVGRNTRHIKIRSLDEVDHGYLVDLLKQSIDFSQKVE